MDKKEEKKFKLTKDNATAEFNRIVEAFNFNVSTEIKKRLVTMDINGISMSMNQELVGADSFIQKIMIGRISFDEDAKQIVYTLSDPVRAGEIVVSEFRFGRFTRAMQKASKVPLNECNFATMKDDAQDSILMAMTGQSDERILNALDISDYNDLRMIAGYFFN